MFSHLSLAASAVVGGILVFIGTQTVNALWIILGAREEGRKLERAELDSATNKAIGELRDEADRARFNRRLCIERAGCTSTQQVSASKDRLNQAARAVVGTALIGAQGATPADQDKIEETVAGLCGARAWTQSECARHDAAQQ